MEGAKEQYVFERDCGVIVNVWCIIVGFKKEFFPVFANEIIVVGKTTFEKIEYQKEQSFCFAKKVKPLILAREATEGESSKVRERFNKMMVYDDGFTSSISLITVIAQERFKDGISLKRIFQEQKPWERQRRGTYFKSNKALKPGRMTRRGVWWSRVLLNALVKNIGDLFMRKKVYRFGYIRFAFDSEQIMEITDANTQEDTNQLAMEKMNQMFDSMEAIWLGGAPQLWTKKDK